MKDSIIILAVSALLALFAGCDQSVNSPVDTASKPTDQLSSLGKTWKEKMQTGAPVLSEAISGSGWDIWSDRTTVPWAQVTFLPIFAPDETPGFVDLGENQSHAGAQWRAMQFTRDKSVTATVPVNTYLFGLLGDDWPANTVNAFEEIHAGRLIAIEVDGTRIDLNPSSILDLSGNGATAIYNVLPRFTAAGTHTLKYYWEQRRAFYFTLPFDLFGVPDPLGLGGRRVFVAGETVGSPVDGVMVLSYTLTVE